MRNAVIVFGATSFVGRILCRYLLERHGVGGELRWAAAGRSLARLEELRAALGPAAAGLPLLVADAGDEASLRVLCAQGRVIVSTVGPYALHGEPLVKVCAETGTDYCDLTGEVQWIRRMLQRHEAAARASGARLVHCCGFDSIPSDLGVFFLQQESSRRFGAACTRVAMRVRALRGGVSGGTVASLLNVVREARADPALRRELADPYSLCPPAVGVRPRQPRVSGARFDADWGVWTAPFVMAAINIRIVLRSHALGGGATPGPGSPELLYDEAVMTGRGLRGRLAALTMSAGLGAFMVASALGPTRWALQRFVLPAPGEGPSPAAQASGFFDLRFAGTTARGDRLRVKVTGDRDPGYGSTAKMLGEAAACLALDLPVAAEGGPAGGFWTPASLLGARLVDRLRANAGLTFDVV
jgi:short subunit dehydrogenase-like uncharacterized protein